MRPPLVTAEEIIEAGRQIRARGEEVTGWAIRRQVGDRGQAKRLEAIWRERGDSAPPVIQDDDAANNLPTPLQELVNESKGALAGQLDTIVAAIHR
ncbi:DNA-binding protein, partial [Paeniroseomonas aquatica]